MSFVRAAVLAMATVTPALAQTPAAPPQEPKAQAFFEFLMARRLEATGDGAGALAGLERARKLDPESAEIVAEIAGYYSRQNRTTDAVTAAEQALKLDKDNVEAHHVLGNLYATWADGGPAAPVGQPRAAIRTTAIEHLSAIQTSPLMATNPNLQMTLGRLYLMADKPDLAVPVLERVVAQAPWAAQPWLLLHQAQLGLDRIEDAERSLVTAAEVDPRHLETLGRFYERQGKWSEAAAAYEAAIGAAPKPTQDLRLRYAAALVNTDGGAARARAVLTELAKASPNDTRVLYMLSTAERTAGDDQAAEATARRILATDATNATGLRALVAVLFDRFDFKQIVEVVSPLAKDPSRAKGREFEGAAVLVQLGIAQQQLAQWDGAIAAFTAAKTLTPRDGEIDAYLVQANLTARRFDRAETIAREALGRDPNQPRMVRLRAQALLKGGKSAEATKLLEDGMAKQPESREFVVGLADLYAELKRTDDAVRVLEQARKTFGDDETLTMRMANVYERGGRLAEAEQELRKLMADDPLNASAMNSLGYMFAERGLRLAEAIDLAQRAVKIEPGNPAYLDTLGWALFKDGPGR